MATFRCILFVFLCQHTCLAQLTPMPEYQGDLMGYKANEQWVIAPAFDDALAFYWPYTFVKKNGLWALIDKEGKKIIDFTYSWIDDMQDSTPLIKVAVKSKVGFINLATGKEVVAPMYDNASLTSDALAPKIPALILLKKGKKGAIYSADGQALVPFIVDFEPLGYEDFGTENNCLFIRGANKKYAIYTPELKQISPFIYTGLEGLIYLNASGTPTTLLEVYAKDKVGVFDLKQAKELQPCQYEQLHYFPAHILLTGSKQSVLLDSLGQVLFEGKFTDLEPIFLTNADGGNVAAFLVIGKNAHGLIDESGKVLVSPVHDDVEILKNYVIVSQKGLYGAYTNEGKLLFPPTFRTSDQASEQAEAILKK